MLNQVEEGAISLLIKLITIILIIVALSTIEKKKEVVKSFFRGINDSLLRCFNSGGRGIKVLLVIAGICAVISVFLTSFQICCVKDGREITAKNIVIMFFVVIISLFIIYVLFGSVMLVFSKTIDVIGNVKNFQLSTRMMASFLLLFLLIFFFFISETVMQENLFFLFVGSATCYVLNINILFKIMQNPFCLIENEREKSRENVALIIICSVLIVLMIIATLYLFVLCAFYSCEEAYRFLAGEGLVTRWNLIYYTVITFTTIGYGDIVPVVFESQVVAIIIAITSVICLVIFINSVLSVKNEMIDKKQDEDKEEEPK